MKILVVEDERDLNRIITKHLKKNNYSVDSCFDGQEALDFISYSEYDLIITDIMMPNVDGYEFIDKLRANKNNSGEIIDLTGKEYEVLEYLMKNKGRILSRDQILNHVWDYEYEGASNIVDVIIKNIRKKLDRGEGNTIIYTKRGLGYFVK